MRILAHNAHYLFAAALAAAVASPVSSAETSPVETARVVVPSVTQAETPAADSLRLVVPCAAGSPGDLIARAVARILSEESGRQVAVENLTASSANPVAEAGKQIATSGNAIALLPAGESDVSPCGE